MKEKTKKQQQALKSYLKFTSMGFQMIGTFLLAAWGGLKLDETYNSAPLFLVGLLLFAVIASVVLLVRTVLFDNKDKDE